MKFTKDHPKLEKNVFTTIRKNTGYYRVGRTYTISTPNDRFKATIASGVVLQKADITDIIAQEDASMTARELVKILERWYGKRYDDFILFRLVRTMGLSPSLRYHEIGRTKEGECVFRDVVTKTFHTEKEYNFLVPAAPKEIAEAQTE